MPRQIGFAVRTSVQLRTLVKKSPRVSPGDMLGTAWGGPCRWFRSENVMKYRVAANAWVHGRYSPARSLSRNSCHGKTVMPAAPRRRSVRDKHINARASSLPPALGDPSSRSLRSWPLPLLPQRCDREEAGPNALLAAINRSSQGCCRKCHAPCSSTTNPSYIM
jgi:hypothetical protein